MTQEGLESDESMDKSGRGKGTLPSFNKGDTVWAKMKGYPYWPAVVCSPLDTVKSPKNVKMYQFVYFLGSKNYSFIPKNLICDYVENQAKLEKAAKTAGFLAAVKEMNELLNSGDTTSCFNNEPDPFDKLLSANTSTPKSSSIPKRKRKGDEDVETPLKKPLRKLSRGTASESPLTRRERADSRRDVHKTPESDYSYNKLRPDKVPDYLKNISKSSIELRAKKIKPSTTKIGFVGICRRSGGILKNFLNTGHNVTIWNNHVESCIPFQKIGGKVASSAVEVINSCDVLVLGFGNDKQASDFIHNKQHIQRLQDLKKKIINLGAISAERSERFSKELYFFCCNYLDVRLLGTEEDADRGTYTAFLAGDAEIIPDIATCLEALTKKYMYVGDCILTMIDLTNARYAIEGALVHHLAHEIKPIANKSGVPFEVWLKLRENIKYYDEEFDRKLTPLLKLSLLPNLREMTGSAKRPTKLPIVRDLMKTL